MTATALEGLVFLTFGKILDRYKPLPLLVAASFLYMVYIIKVGKMGS
ncbi:hypothetical protein [Alkalihalobacillus sp. BA299]|nr:hypothetical protein [Alkalihalobacillus sp. BA299]